MPMMGSEADKPKPQRRSADEPLVSRDTAAYLEAWFAR
jgi:hypothetical protein